VGDLERTQHLFLAGAQGPVRGVVDQELRRRQGNRSDRASAGALHLGHRHQVHQPDARIARAVRHPHHPPYRSHLNDRAFIDDLAKVSDQVNSRRHPPARVAHGDGWATHTPHNTLRRISPRTRSEPRPNSSPQLLMRHRLRRRTRTFWYDFRNDGDDPIYFEHQMGIIYSDFRPNPPTSPTPRWRACSKVNGWTARAGARRRIGLQVQAGRRATGAVIAAWSPLATPGSSCPPPATASRASMGWATAPNSGWSGQGPVGPQKGAPCI